MKKLSVKSTRPTYNINSLVARNNKVTNPIILPNNFVVTLSDTINRKIVAIGPK